MPGPIFFWHDNKLLSNQDNLYLELYTIQVLLFGTNSPKVWVGDKLEIFA